MAPSQEATRLRVARPRTRMWFTVILSLVMATLLLTTGCTTNNREPSPPPEPPPSLKGSVRPATFFESWAIGPGHAEGSLLDDVFVATKDIQTTGKEGPITIIFPRDPHDPNKAIKWLGGPLGITTLLFEAKVDANTPDSRRLAIERGLLYRDPICTLAEYGHAPSTLCDQAPYDRQPGSHADMQARLKPAPVPDNEHPPYLPQNPQVPVKQHKWFIADPGDMTLSPPKSYDSAQTIELDDHTVMPGFSFGRPGTEIVGGDLGANIVVVAEGTEGDEKWINEFVYDAFCVPSSSGDGPAFPLSDWHMFLAEPMIEHIKTSCVRN